MLVLIDGDIVLYRAAASAEDDDPDIAMIRCDKTMEEILADTGATEYKVFITGTNNFRRELDPEYKANRKDVPRPRHWQICRDFMERHHKAIICDGYEADDALGMHQTNDSIICSIDKDLLMIPGRHYNWVKKIFSEVTADEGLRAFYMSTLIGDRSDNITGVVGIGPKKAEKLLGTLLPEELYDACRLAYNDEERFHRNCKLLWIWRTVNDVWKPPVQDSSEDFLRGEENLPLSLGSISRGGLSDSPRERTYCPSDLGGNT
jgi:5'-3' exonuclease